MRTTSHKDRGEYTVNIYTESVVHWSRTNCSFIYEKLDETGPDHNGGWVGVNTNFNLGLYVLQFTKPTRPWNKAFPSLTRF